MIKSIEVTKTIKESHKYCDVCGKEIRKDMACCAARCEYCLKDLCDKCVAGEDSSMGDYRIVYCEKCYDIKMQYQPQIDELESQIDKLNDEMMTKCRMKPI